MRNASLRARWRRAVSVVRRALVAVVPLFILDATCEPVFAKKATLVALPTGEQVVPVVRTPALGGVSITVDTDTNELSYRISFGGLSSAETLAHFHGPALPGQNAGVMHALPLGNPKVGVWNYAENQEAAILGGLVYLNIHSSDFPGGEIRGQLTNLAARVDSTQEVPPNASTASGWGVYVIDTCTNTLEYHIQISGLSSAETAAHIHGPALHGQNAAPLHTLPLGSPKVGAWTYPQELEEPILDGLTYVNVHTANFPGGEIRGQIVSAVSPIDGLQEVPPVVTGGYGVGITAIDRSGDALSYYILFGGLTGVETLAHIHGFAPPGVNAGVLHALALGNPKLGTWNYAAGDEDLITSNLTYINIHTTAQAGGEIRGQVLSPPEVCAADLDCDGQVGVTDFLEILAAWGPCPAPCPPTCPADLDGDCTVGVNDFLQLLADWGPCP